MKIKNTRLLRQLTSSGLGEKEATVYTALFELGGGFPSSVAEYTGINRTTVYDILLSLSVKGLVNEIKRKNKQYYQPEKPAKLLKYLKNKVAIAEEELEKAESAIPDLEGIYQLSAGKPKVFYFEGIEGILSVYEDHITVDKPYEMKAWANAMQLENILPTQFFDRYRKTKQKKHITTRGIFADTPVNHGFLKRRYAGFRPEIVPKIRYTPANLFPFKAEITIYGEKRVSIINLDTQHYSGVIIEDATIHGLMSMIFEVCWNAGKD